MESWLRLVAFELFKEVVIEPSLIHEGDFVDHAIGVVLNEGNLVGGCVEVGSLVDNEWFRDVDLDSIEAVIAPACLHFAEVGG